MIIIVVVVSVPVTLLAAVIDTVEGLHEVSNISSGAHSSNCTSCSCSCSKRNMSRDRSRSKDRYSSRSRIKTNSSSENS